MARNAAARLAAGAAPDQAAGLARLLTALPWTALAALHARVDAGDLRAACSGARWLPSAPAEPALRRACEGLFRRLLLQARNMCPASVCWVATMHLCNHFRRAATSRALACISLALPFVHTEMLLRQSAAA